MDWYYMISVNNAYKPFRTSNMNIYELYEVFQAF